MKYLLISMSALLLFSCGKPDPYNMVRKHRISYKIDKIDFIINEETNELTYNVKVINNSGGENLQELTVLLEAMDGDQKVFWSKLEEFNLSGVGNYGTRDFEDKEQIEDAAKIEYFNVTPAPHSEDSDFMNYKEFKRVVH